jgi:3'(2'), 5'-bisphosphate nucleotidase
MYEQEVGVAIRLAREGGSLAQAIAARGFAVERKSANELVTEADRAVNEWIVSGLREAFPLDAIVAEETPDNGQRAARTWYVDPIDGTADFVKRNGEWCVMLGLAVEGYAVVGVVYQPHTDELYAAVSGGGAWRHHGGEVAPVVSRGHREEGWVLIESRSHPDAVASRLGDTLRVSGRFAHGSLGCKLARIAEGRADIYANGSGRCHQWDTCAGEVVLRESGGDLRTATGQRIQYGGRDSRIAVPFIAATTAAWPAIDKVLHELL